MHIHAITYTNIGPFTDTRSVVFQSGKFLIKASIGSGKSFLFFDGPIFGLYKYAARPMLNKNSTEGAVKILFSTDGEYYMITRQLQHGKKKDKVQSQFFRVEYEAPHLSDGSEKEVVQLNDHIQELIDSKKILLDEIVFKSDTELQKTIQDLLPPKEVLTTTQFLLQDSDNFFAMTPADRITVFKNIFNLLSIDDAKEKISEQRRDIQARIRIMQDSDEGDKQLQGYMTQLLQDYQHLKTEKGVITRLEDLALVHSTAGDQRSVQSFDTSIIDTQSLEKQLETLEKSIEELQSQQTILTQINERLTAEIEQGKNLKKIQADVQLQLEQRQKELAENTKATDPTKLTQQIQQLLDDQQAREKEFDRDKIQAAVALYIQDNQSSQLPTKEITNLQDLSATIVTLRNQGVLLRQQLESTTNLHKEYLQQLQEAQKQEIQYKDNIHESQETKQAIANHQTLLHNQRDAILKQRKSLEEKKEVHEQQVKDLEAQLKTMNKDLTTAKRFPCSKINADCPFIEQIASASLGKFTKQVSLLEGQLTTLKQSFDENKRSQEYQETVVAFKEVSDKIQLLKNQPEKAIPDFFAQQEKHHQRLRDEIVVIQQKITEGDGETKQKDLEKKIEQLGVLLKDLDRKKVDEATQKIQASDKQIKELQQELTEQQSRFQQRQDKEKEIVTLQTRLQEGEKQLKDLGSSVRTNQEKQQNIQKVLADDVLVKQLQSKKILEAMILCGERIKELAHQSSSKQQQVKQLQIDEARIKNLYHIFSKELMYVVLEDTLPVLFDIINAYLAQIVDYSINFALIKTASDKLELEVTVHDSKGERLISSLSGGQKVVLKLVRILAIVSYTRGTSLFLDETINNLDTDTVSRVATMLEDFVRQRDVKLYVVTHSPQIQQMNIWDGIINL